MSVPTGRSVSYTHLDVYKRQHITSAMQIHMDYVHTFNTLLSDVNTNNLLDIYIILSTSLYASSSLLSEIEQLLVPSSEVPLVPISRVKGFGLSGSIFKVISNRKCTI